MTSPFLERRLREIEEQHQARLREIDRDGRLFWVLIALIVFAPEIIWIGRKLLL